MLSGARSERSPLGPKHREGMEGMGGTFVQLTGNSCIKRFLRSLSTPGRLAHPTPCTAPGLSGAQEMETQPPCKPPYRRRARRPGPAEWSTPGSRLSLPGPGRAPHRSAAPAGPDASARGPWACNGRHSRSRGSTPPRCTGELKNSTKGRLHSKPRRRPGCSYPRKKRRPARMHCALTGPCIKGTEPK